MKALAGAGAIIAALVVLYAISFPSTTIRYRLTLEAEVDGKPVAGSGVLEVVYAKNPQVLGASAETKVNVRGEAVTLNLGAGRTVFALLRGDTDSRSGAEWLVLRVFDSPGGASPGPLNTALPKVKHLPGKVELPLGSLPLLVRFRDFHDPTTVERVDPFDFAKTLGPDCALMRATIEVVPAGIWPLSWVGITGEPITNDLSKTLPWLVGMTRNLDGTSFTSSTKLSNVLNSSDFRRQ